MDSHFYWILCIKYIVKKSNWNLMYLDWKFLCINWYIKFNPLSASWFYALFVCKHRSLWIVFHQALEKPGKNRSFFLVFSMHVEAPMVTDWFPYFRPASFFFGSNRSRLLFFYLVATINCLVLNRKTNW